MKLITTVGCVDEFAEVPSLFVTDIDEACLGHWRQLLRRLRRLNKDEKDTVHCLSLWWPGQEYLTWTESLDSVAESLGPGFLEEGLQEWRLLSEAAWVEKEPPEDAYARTDLRTLNLHPDGDLEFCAYLKHTDIPIHSRIVSLQELSEVYNELKGPKE
jgi:hypothetical protein